MANLVPWLVLVTGAAALTCHPKCKCVWRNGKQTAECMDLSLTKIPSDMDVGLQVINLNKNRFPFLMRNAFVEAGLVNLQRIYLRECNVEQVDEFAFHRVSNLVELDLSSNRLLHVPSLSFRSLPLLRHLTLNDNPITFLGSQGFTDLKRLIVLELSNCRLDIVNDGAFDSLDKLEVLKLDGNNLETMSGKAMLPLKALHGITIDSNPWICDCKLRTFRQWLDGHNIPYVAPLCNKPARLKGKSWASIELDDYACPPAFINSSSAFNVFEGSNVTLECKVSGDPSPKVQWFWRDRVISNLSEGISSRQVFLVGEHVEKDKYSTLTITSVQEPNAGSYSCQAENVAARITKNFTVLVSRKPVTEVKVAEEEEKTQEVREQESSGSGGGGGEEDHGSPLIGMIVGVVVGALIVLLIFSVVLLVCRRRKRNVQRKRTDSNHKMSNSISAHEPAEDSDMKLLAVNPVEKPPRLGIYHGVREMDHLEPLMMDSSLTPHVWVVKDHLSPVDYSLPPKDIKRSSLRSPIPVPMPQPPEDLHSRLHNELADTLRRKGERKIIERERGDGSSELENLDFEGKPSFETLRARELERNLRPENHQEERTPDLIDLPKKILESDSDSWEPYDHPSAYFRPQQPAAEGSNYEGGSDGTEV